MKGEEANYPSFMDIYLTIAGDVEALGRIIDHYDEFACTRTLIKLFGKFVSQPFSFT